jgi:carbon monoxide dehydrogenase subunit G
MEIKGEYRIAAPREKVFAALNDQAVLQACIPGCESLEKTSDTEMKAKVRMRIGPVSASFSGKVTLSDIDPPNGYRISGEGQGGPAGFAKGGAVVTLREEGGETALSYVVDAQVGGKIAQVGARLIDGTAKKLADEFFSKFAAMVGGPLPAAVAGTPSSAELPTAAPPSAAAQRGYTHWLVIGVGAVALILVFLVSR